MNWIAELIYLWREWGCVRGLLLRRGLLCHRLNVRLLCGLILRLAHALDLVEPDVIDESLRAVLFGELAGTVSESAAHLHAFFQVVDHILIECLQHHAVSVAVTVMLEILILFFLLFELKSTHEASQQPTEIQHTEKCNAKNCTEANLTKDVTHLSVLA